jgi:hypothetical protein
MATFKHTGLNSPITEFSIMLVGRRDDQYSVVGSGIMIGQRVAITAYHVIDELHNIFDDERADRTGSNITTQFTLQAIHFPNNGTTGWAWDVRQVFHDDQLDVAFLRLQPTNEEQLSYNWRSPRLQLLPPPVGTVVSAFGYHSSETEIDRTSQRVQITTNPFTSTGIVQEIHHIKRDTVMLPFPCFRTDCRFDRGMSGGPVFSSTGALCGIICTNFTNYAPDEAEHHTSYVAALWPSMVTKVAFNRSGYPPDVYYPAFELVKDGFVMSVDWEQFRLEHDHATGIATIRASVP